MGGSGGSSGLGMDEIIRISKKAKRALREGDGGGKRAVFLSFRSTDLNAVNLLRGQAKNQNSEIEFIDWSVKVPFDSDDAEYVRRKIRERIRQCSVTVVYVSEETARSQWVDWEVRESIALGKGVVAMHEGESPPPNLPEVIVRERISVVPWNHRELSRAIEQAAKRREK